MRDRTELNREMIYMVAPGRTSRKNSGKMFLDESQESLANIEKKLSLNP